LAADRIGAARTHRRLAAAALLGALVPSGVANAQRGPVFQLQPGLQVSDFISVPEGTATNSAFSVRFTTRFPTSVQWLMPVVGAALLPYGSTQNTIRNTDAPTIFAGNIFTLLAPAETAGWLSIELPLLIAHAPGTATTGNLRNYGRDLVIAPTVYLHLGSQGLGEFGPLWSRLNVFVQFEQTLTPNRDPATGERDFFNPLATFGVSLRIGGPPTN
jgi:hypothetical protein